MPPKKVIQKPTRTSTDFKRKSGRGQGSSEVIFFFFLCKYGDVLIYILIVPMDGCIVSIFFLIKLQNYLFPLPMLNYLISSFYSIIRLRSYNGRTN